MALIPVFLRTLLNLHAGAPSIPKSVSGTPLNDDKSLVRILIHESSFYSIIPLNILCFMVPVFLKTFPRHQQKKMW